MSGDSSSAECVLQARWVLTGDGPPIPHGQVRLAGDRIVAVERDGPLSGAVINLGEALILPGLVNAHTHLEFSDCQRPLGKPGDAFADWIGSVTRHRINRAEIDPAAPARAIEQGIAESVAAGTTSLGEIATALWRMPENKAIPLDMVAFWEVIALAAENFPDKLAGAKHHAQAAGHAGWLAGVSPHAPYTVHPALFDRITEWAVVRRLPLAFHLAESPDELELLSAGTGPMVEYLASRGFWIPGAISLGTRPLDYLKKLAAAPRVLLIHGNYLDDEELDFIASFADRMSVVYCPRTHDYFRHARYPLEEMLRLGVSVALGTDSRASNPDLSILAEMRYVARQYPTLSPDRIVAMGTLAGARALGLDHETGSLAAGKYANLIVLASPPGAADPYEVLFSRDERPTATMYRGQWIVRANDAA